MENLKIRPAVQADLEKIETIYEAARDFMRENGNPTQWKDGYPQRELLEADIARENLYVVMDEEEICGVFLFVIGEDPTYGYIEDGTWRSDSTYGTIHRIASYASGVFAAAVAFGRSQCPHIRVDTHADNKPMQHLAEKHGFSRRGIIYVSDGTPRIAYDLI
jgi:RimJ/RimL family protein N-acetyltransferase